MANNNHESLTPHPPSQGRYLPINTTTMGHSNLPPIVPRSPSFHAALASPPRSPRLGHPMHHNRAPSYSAIDVVDLLASQAINGSKLIARDWTKITLGELVKGQKLVFVDGDTPVEEACQVLPLPV
jgi:hypothetical protein